MDDSALLEQITELNRKLDFVMGEMELQRRRREEMEDLKQDLVRVGRDLFDTAVWELEEVHDSMETGDVLHLMKKLLRNIRSLTKMFEQLENLRDFFQDFSPVSRELFNDLMLELHDMEQRGYFAFAAGLKKAADNVVTSFSGEDVRALADNVVSILATVKDLTQPEMLLTVNNALRVYRNLDVEVEANVSIFALLREMNRPEVRRGLALALRILRNLAQPPGDGTTKHNTLNIS